MDLMVLFGGKVKKIRDHLNKLLRNKYTSYDFQNEIFQIMAFHVLHEKIEESYDERLSFSLQSVKENSEFQGELLSKMRYLDLIFNSEIVEDNM